MQYSVTVMLSVADGKSHIWTWLHWVQEIIYGAVHYMDGNDVNNVFINRQSGVAVNLGSWISYILWISIFRQTVVHLHALHAM